MLRGLAFLSKVIITITLEASLIAVVAFGLRNTFPLVVDVSPRLTELLPLTTIMVSRMTARAILSSSLSDMHFRQRSSTRRALLLVPNSELMIFLCLTQSLYQICVDCETLLTVLLSDESL
jgi:hypothetical protein